MYLPAATPSRPEVLEEVTSPVRRSHGHVGFLRKRREELGVFSTDEETPSAAPFIVHVFTRS